MERNDLIDTGKFHVTFLEHIYYSSHGSFVSLGEKKLKYKTNIDEAESNCI